MKIPFVKSGTETETLDLEGVKQIGVTKNKDGYIFKLLVNKDEQIRNDTKDEEWLTLMNN